MPSFDVVSEVDMHEAQNAVDQANKEVSTRFDFKGVTATYERKENVIELETESDFQAQQMRDILYSKLHKRGIDISCAEEGDVVKSGMRVKQNITLRQGIDAEIGKKINKMIKDAKLKVQSSIQGDKVRVTGKKRDDLQSAIAMLKSAELDLPLQFNNFRD